VLDTNRKGGDGEPLSTYGREVRRGWWRPKGFIVNFMIFTASVRKILDTPSYKSGAKDKWASWPQLKQLYYEYVRYIRYTNQQYTNHIQQHAHEYGPIQNTMT
jgi:hypothetical protein